MKHDLKAFAAQLARLGLSETGHAIALLWYLEETSAVAEATAADLADLMHDLALRGRVNISRLARQLAINRDVIRAKGGAFRIRLASKARLTERYAELAAIKTAPRIDPQVISPAEFEGARPYMRSLVEQINGTFQFAFYDACAVLCRRLMETLLIEAFEQNEQASAIRTADGYMQLGDLIRLAASGRYIKLARGTHAAMQAIKKVGDTAAHHRTYITKELDLDDQFRLKLRLVLSDLIHIAKLDLSP